jgi:hypothetical protein
MTKPTLAPETMKSLDGFDPLAADSEGASMTAVLEEASKRIVHNILKSYTGYFDLFSELIQNALDAVETRQRLERGGYQPKIWIAIDIPSRMLRVVDNGIGMNENEFKYCLRPSVSFKRQADLRGHKGVGATFIAYGFSFVKLQSRQAGLNLAAILRQGRQWAEDSSGTVPRPKFEAVEFSVPELAKETSGTCAEVIVGQANGEPRGFELRQDGAPTSVRLAFRCECLRHLHDSRLGLALRVCCLPVEGNEDTHIPADFLMTSLESAIARHR